MRLLLLVAAGLWWLALPAHAQKTKVKTRTATSVKGGVTVTSTSKMLVFNRYKDSGLNFSLAFPPDADVQATDRPGLYAVNGQPLQVLAVPAASYPADSTASSLEKYVQSEARYLINSLPKPVEPFAQIGQDKQTGRAYAVWGFPMPEGYNQQVIKQVFVTFLDGDFLVGVSSSQLKGQEFEQTLRLLFDAAHSYRSSKEPIAAN